MEKTIDEKDTAHDLRGVAEDEMPADFDQNFVVNPGLSSLKIILCVQFFVCFGYFRLDGTPISDLQCPALEIQKY